MNAKAYSMEVVPRMAAAGRMERLAGVDGFSTGGRVIRLGKLAPASRPGVLVAPAAGWVPPGDFWETASYAALGLCGLGAIALSLL